MSQTLVRYDAMCSAIAACHAIDEVMEIHDKARALEVYAMQAKNTEAETKACEIRLRAERKAGQMLQTMEKAKGSQGQLVGPGVIGPTPAVAPTKTLEDQRLAPNEAPQRQAGVPRGNTPARSNRIVSKSRVNTPRAGWM